MTRLKIKIGLMLILFMLACTITSYAGEGGLSVTRSDEGDLAVYTIRLAPDSKVQAANYTLSDKDGALEFLDQQEGPAASADGAMFVTNLDTEGKWLKLGYISTNPDQEDGTLLTVRFKKTDEASEMPIIGLAVDEMKDGDGNDLPQSISGDSSVGVVPSGETINDAGIIPQAVQTSSIEDKGNNKDAVKSENAGNMSEQLNGNASESPEKKAGIPGKSMATLCIILGILAVILIIVAVLKKKGLLFRQR